MKLILCVAFMLITSMMPVAAGGVGFSRIVTSDPMGGEMMVSLWYPTDQASGTVRVGPFTFQATRDAEPANGRRGLVVISHGTAGSDLGHRNIAMALAEAGFIAAAPLHPRDNYEDRPYPVKAGRAPWGCKPWINWRYVMVGRAMARLRTKSPRSSIRRRRLKR